MNLFQLTRALIDIESITNNEERVGQYLYQYLAPLAPPRGSRYLSKGERTGNRLALGSNGALRCEVVGTRKMAHSAYTEPGDSAIHKLFDALSGIPSLPLTVDELLGSSTLNIGNLSGGR